MPNGRTKHGANGNGIDPKSSVGYQQAQYGKQTPTYSYPSTAKKYFGMHEREHELIDPESPTAAREWQIQSRGGAYSDRIIRKPRKIGPRKERVLKT